MGGQCPRRWSRQGRSGVALRAQRTSRGRSEVGDEVPRKGRARRFREARALKQGYDDGLFSEDSGTLADLEEGTLEDRAWDDEVDADDDEWDEEDPLVQDERFRGGSRRAEDE